MVSFNLSEMGVGYNHIAPMMRQLIATASTTARLHTTFSEAVPPMRTMTVEVSWREG